MEFLTSPEALAIISSLGLRLFPSFDAFSLSLRRTFSTSTMASSTTIPMATARPPRVMEFTLMSMRVKMIMVTAKERGIAVRVMRVVRSEVSGLRMLKRKTQRTAMTQRPPSRMASSRLCMAASINVAWRKRGVSWMSRPWSLSCSDISAMAFSILEVSFLVSIPGDLTTLRTTPGAPFTPASPRCGSMPKVMLVTSARVKVRSATFLTTVFLISLRSVVIARTRIICS